MLLVGSQLPSVATVMLRLLQKPQKFGIQKVSQALPARCLEDLETVR